MIETSAELNELAKALSLAQSEIMAASKDRENPYFKSSYATLASVWDACRGPLTKNGLSVTQLPVNQNGTVGVVTTLLHGSGQWMRSVLFATPEKNTPQAIGSTLTYVRRYALSAVVGVAPEDDDGNEGSGKENGKPAVAGGAAKANTVKATPAAQKVRAGQIQQIHIMKEQIGGWTGKADHDKHPYRAALMAYKDASGKPIVSSTDLTFEQAKNLLTRMQGMIDRQAETLAKAEAAAPINDNAREPGSDDGDEDTGEAPEPELIANLREAAKSHWGKKTGDLAPQWLEMEYGVKTAAELTKYQATHALQRLLSGNVLA